MRQWVLSLPIPLRLLLASQPELLTSVLQVVQGVLMRHLLDRAGLTAAQGQGRRRHADPALRIGRQPEHHEAGRDFAR